MYIKLNLFTITCTRDNLQIRRLNTLKEQILLSLQVNYFTS